MSNSPGQDHRSGDFYLPKIEQIAYVVDDLHEAIRYWGEKLGVGPFLVREHVQYSTLKFRGVDSPADYSLAQAWQGDMQIELLQQHNDAASVLRNFPAAPNVVHHLGALTQDIDADGARLVARGFEDVQRIVMGNGTKVGFYHGGQGLGIIELIEPADGGSAWNEFKEASRHWDRKSLYAS